MEHFIGNLLQDFEHGKMNRRQLIQSLALAVTTASALSAAPTVAADNKVVKAVRLDHISYQVADYTRTRDFYSELFGMTVSQDNHETKQCKLSFGDSIIVLHTRTPNPVVDHICFTIAGWDSDKNVRNAVEAELERRGLEVREREMDNSLYIKDPDGFEVQLGGKTRLKV
jgi:catechol 2,3-dioxygenase-like lactoylglutathione lyase family enzyme